MSCITFANLFVLVNGERLDSFSLSRGICQGDPLSPYLFILYMEYLAFFIETKKSCGNWTGIKTSREGLIFSHLFFANDLLPFAKATKTNCLTIKKVLSNFYSCSSEKVNPSKSKIFFSPYTKIEHISFIEHELGMHRSNSFDNYLRVPIIMDKRDKRAFDFVIDKIRTKLSAWKAWSLSLVGRLTLVNSVASAIPTHIMQCNLLPTGIWNELDQINHNFLWGDETSSKKMHALN